MQNITVGTVHPDARVNAAGKGLLCAGVLFLAASAGYAGEPCSPSWDNAIGQPGMGGISIPSVWALAVLPNGDLIVGGDFTMAGDVSANRIARWDGESWHPLGGGMNNDVRALTVLPSSTPGGGADVVAAGHFSNAGGVSAIRIARWDGKSWHPIGGGLNAHTYALTVVPSAAAETSGDLIAGGAFFLAGGQSALYIARWDGEAWHSLGGGMNATVEALTVLPSSASGSGDDLIAGGIFTSAGGVSAQRIARWDGEFWHPFGSGLNSRVSALVVMPNGDVIAGGQFTSAGGASANHIARWDGKSWHVLGGGTNDWVRALAVLPDGSLVAGGTFTTAGGANSPRIARWDGSSWSSLGSGIGSSAVVALNVVSNGDLVAGGWFDSAGGLAVNSIATWRTCSAPVPAIPGDVTGDGAVNVNDLLAVIGAWGPCRAPPADCPADIAPPSNGDGVVDVNDLLMVIAHWN